MMQIRKIWSIIALVWVVVFGCSPGVKEANFGSAELATKENEGSLAASIKRTEDMIIKIGIEPREPKPGSVVNVTLSMVTFNMRDVPDISLSLQDGSGKIHAACRPQPRGFKEGVYTLSGSINIPKTGKRYKLVTDATKIRFVRSVDGTSKVNQQKKPMPTIPIIIR